MTDRKLKMDMTPFEIEQYERKQRVIETARLIAVEMVNQPAKMTASASDFCPICFKIAEIFEQAAEKYLKGEE